MRIAIIDTLTLSLDKSIYGHFHKVSLQYFEILSKKFKVKIVGGKTYCNYFSSSELEILFRSS